MRRVVILLLVLIAGTGCGDGDDASDVTTTSTSTSTVTTSSTSSTTAFDGSTSPTSIASTAPETALLTEVAVGDGVVTFVFRAGTPGIDVRYVEPPVTQDASGEPVDVNGGAFLSVRMEPASGVDLTSGSETPEETYVGPERIDGTPPIAEVVRTGDFEANLTWVIGLDEERAYRVEAAASTVRVYISR